MPTYLLLLITRQSGRSCFLAHQGDVKEISIPPRCQRAETLPNSSGSLGVNARRPHRPNTLSEARDRYWPRQFEEMASDQTPMSWINEPLPPAAYRRLKTFIQ